MHEKDVINMDIKVPEYALKALNVLESHGFEAYCVGGCVRDSLLGKTPHDWDICTNAMPQQIKEIFTDYFTVDTGLKHGTLTAIIDRNPVEITTYRTDGEYKDHRRPEEVQFVRDLRQDLSRRDFTVNAMCWNPKTGLVDIFGGRQDLDKHIIRCVGEPHKRFEEDALRILRALRFSSKLGFDIEENTKSAAMQDRELLKCISAERIFSELKGLLCGKDAVKVLIDMKEIIAVFIPEVAPCFGFKQNNPHHIYDVWEHICHSVGYARPDETICLAMLLHDIGKPQAATVDENGINHFKKHQFISADMSNEILNRLRCDNASKQYVHDLIYEHDNRIPVERKSVKRFISRHDMNFFMDYLEVRRADTYAQSDYHREEKLRDLDSLAMIAFQLEKENACLKISDLMIDGRDMIALGYSGKTIGEALNFALDAVLSEDVDNSKQALLDYIKDNFK